MKAIFFHNPECSKSRAALAYLTYNDIPVEIERYLEQEYSIEQLQDLAKKLGIKNVREMMRCKDELFAQLNLDEASEAELFEALSENIELLERPIIIYGDKAKIARPPESVLTIF